MIEVLKSVQITDNGDGVTGIGDVATYTIAVQNTGNVTLDNITVVDTLTDLNGNALNLDSGPSYSGSDQGSALGTLQPGETSNYTAFYIIDQTVMENGGLVNVATATNGTVSDTSNTVTTTVVASPSLEVTKIASINTDDGDGLIGADDIIKYTITVRNTGNLTLTNLTFTDVMTDGNGGALNLTIAPAFDSTTKGSAPRTIKVGEVQTWNAYYTITEAVEQTGRVINSIVGTANTTSGQVSDTSDNGDDSDGNTVDDATVVEMSTTSTDTTAYPRLGITKTASVNDIDSDGNNLGDDITYTIRVENTGNVVLSNLTLTDTLTDGE